MHPLPLWLLWLVGAYLVGAVPFGLLIGLARGVDIRAAGSGNVGATNAGRLLGRPWGIACFILDVGKGLGPVLAFGLTSYATIERALAEWVGGSGSDGGSGSALAALAWMAIAAAAVLGHVFPLYLKGRGGKGVATGLGVVLGLWPVLTLPGIAAGLGWFVIVLLTGYVSLASVLAAAALPLLTLASALALGLAAGEIAVYVALTALMGLLVVVRHRSNIANLRAGTESRVSWALRGR